jgi:hypothetical protein
VTTRGWKCEGTREPEHLERGEQSRFTSDKPQRSAAQVETISKLLFSPSFI